MLKLNLQRVFALRGIDKPFRLMTQAGISRTTAYNLLNNLVESINSAHLEKLCEMLNCEPNDFYEWKPSKDTQNAATHPLRNLKREANVESIKQILKNIPLDQISKLDSILEEMNKTEPQKDS
ncbi:MAG TPA: helix-turn-helix transcriptional regulator [Pyrinomonadaceae bacterium]|nr:helix-turn-helix transcriptional regulator [Pyrinomonadaceae bacterium]